MKIGSRVWDRSTSVNQLGKVTSRRDDKVYSQGIPIPFPRYDLPEDGRRTLAATDGQHIGLTATEHAGHAPAALASAKLSSPPTTGARAGPKRRSPAGRRLDRHREPRG